MKSKGDVQLGMLEPQTIEEALRDLHLADFNTAAWLDEHTPSAALLLCLGSGPWPLPRRQTVQESLLAELAKTAAGDVTQAAAARFVFPLAWQSNFYTKAFRYCQKNKCVFNEAFNRGRAPAELLSRFEACFGPLHSVPKVLGMFARDYLRFNDAFPIDRHVRKWLKDRKLSTKYEVIVPFLKQHGAVPATVSRAIFGKHSSNPQHKPTHAVCKF